MWSMEKFKRKYEEYMGKEMNLDNPKCLVDKLLYLNIYKQNDMKSNCADKIKVRDYIEEKGLSNYLPKLLGVYDDANEINFNELPKRFVLKCNHAAGSKYIVVCDNKDSLNIPETITKLNDGLISKFPIHSSGAHYAKIVPKILCEEFFEASDEYGLVDYKIWCTNGNPQCIGVYFDRRKGLKRAFYDLKWNNVTDHYILAKKSKVKLKKPKKLNLMLEIAKKLSQDFDFVRVDFYIINDIPVIGELTFTPAGIFKLKNSYTDNFLNELGEKLIIGKCKY